MECIKNEYCQLLPNNQDTKPSVARLQYFVNRYFTDGKILPPKGLTLT